MTEYRTVRGFILDTQPYQETSALVTCYTPQYGKILFKAQGLKKSTSKLSYHILPGNIVYLTLYKNRGWHLTGAKSIFSSGLILHSLPHYKMMCALREIALTLLPLEQADADLYEAFETFIYFVSDTGTSVRARKAAFYRFVILMYQRLGLFPDYTRCSQNEETIKRSRDLYWCVGKGFLCNRCALRESPKSCHSLGLFGSFFTQSPTRISPVNSREREFVLEDIIRDVFEREAEKELISLK